MPQQKYNVRWPDDVTPLGIELGCIANGGRWIGKQGQECGAGMIDHLMHARRMIWPDRYRHAWTDLMYSEFIKNDITILMGAASTQKTSHASEFVLLNYWARHEKTLVVLSTMTMEKLDTGVFGEVKMLWSAGKRLFPFLSGHLLEARRAITTDRAMAQRSKTIDEIFARDMRKGIIGRPCYGGAGQWIGLGVLAGTKQEYIFYLCDEVQFMAESFIGAWPNLFSNGNVKIIGSGNPKHDPDDQLGIAAEPKDGWSSVGDTDKVQVWDTQFMGGRCINLVGTDSPNFHLPPGVAEYPKLIGPKYAQRIIHDFGENSPEYYSQVKGVMKLDFAGDRVITRQACREHNAQERAVWSGRGSKTRVIGLDPSYGGGDLCVAIVLDYGDGDNGIMLIEVVEMITYRFDLRDGRSVETQLAEKFSEDLIRLGVEVQNSFYDPYGKGTMGFAFAQKFGSASPRPIDSGGQPTERPVRDDLYVDEKDGVRRLKMCKEHYAKFVTEAWFSVRYAIEANQVKGLPTDVMLEGCARKYERVAGNKLSVESKEDFKKRLGHSPNKFDALAIAVEGARVIGFRIGKLGPAAVIGAKEDDYFAEEAKEWEDAIKSRLLTHK